MSMCLVIYTLSDTNIQKVLADPPLIWKVIASADPDPYENARVEPSGFFSKVFGRKNGKTEQPAELLLAEDEIADIDIDKAWHGLHYMLTKSAWEGEAPLNFLVKGGGEVGDIDVGYGPARVFTSDDVHKINAALKPIDGEFLKSRFDPIEMTKLEIYPDIWERNPEEDDTFGYCEEYFGVLKSFVEQAAERNLGLVICLS
ncbi:MAG: YfbM family protein [Chloroflexi bacterium]|nr:YfbM family protein [Chloroflexota bacterium]